MVVGSGVVVSSVVVVGSGVVVGTIQNKDSTALSIADFICLASRVASISPAFICSYTEATPFLSRFEKNSP